MNDLLSLIPEAWLPTILTILGVITTVVIVGISKFIVKGGLSFVITKLFKKDLVKAVGQENADQLFAIVKTYGLSKIVKLVIEYGGKLGDVFDMLKVIAANQLALGVIEDEELASAIQEIIDK